jgi:hypothetical protein
MKWVSPGYCKKGVLKRKNGHPQFGSFFTGVKPYLCVFWRLPGCSFVAAETGQP